MNTKEVFHKNEAGEVFKVALIPIDAMQAVQRHPHQWSLTTDFAKTAPKRATAAPVVGLGGGVLTGGLGVLAKIDPKDIAKSAEKSAENPAA